LSKSQYTDIKGSTPLIRALGLFRKDRRGGLCFSKISVVQSEKYQID
jgi:hypothetical protein